MPTLGSFESILITILLHFLQIKLTLNISVFAFHLEEIALYKKIKEDGQFHYKHLLMLDFYLVM